MDNDGIESIKTKIKSWQAHYLKAGSGPPVVLLHGGASDARDWTNTMTALGNRYTFYALDLLGYGQSEKNEKGYYFNDFVEFLMGFIDTLKLERPVLAGHSLGGRFCLDLVFKDPKKVGKLVLVDTTGLGDMSAFGNGLQLMFWGARKVFRIKQPHPTFLLKEGESFNHNYDEELRQLKIPTLLVWNRFDPYLPVSIARRAVKKIPGAKLVVMMGYGHAPHKKNSEKFNKILAEFLREGC